MLASAPVVATIPAEDLERATRFYRDSLGLKVAMEMEGGVGFECGDGTRLFVYVTAGAGGAAHTLAGWMVDDLDAEMADLRSRGVTFEDYDLPGITTVDGVADMGGVRGSWFKDSEGNILGVTENFGQ